MLFFFQLINRWRATDDPATRNRLETNASVDGSRYVYVRPPWDSIRQGVWPKVPVPTGCLCVVSAWKTHAQLLTHSNNSGELISYCNPDTVPKLCTHNPNWSSLKPCEQRTIIIPILEVRKQRTQNLLLLFSCSVLWDSLQPHGLQHARLLCPSLPPVLCSKSCPLRWWCHPTISSSVTSFSRPQTFPASGSFQNLT